MNFKLLFYEILVDNQNSYITSILKTWRDSNIMIITCSSKMEGHTADRVWFFSERKKQLSFFWHEQLDFVSIFVFKQVSH